MSVGNILIIYYLAIIFFLVILDLTVLDKYFKKYVRSKIGEKVFFFLIFLPFSIVLTILCIYVDYTLEGIGCVI